MYSHNNSAVMIVGIQLRKNKSQNGLVFNIIESYPVHKCNSWVGDSGFEIEFFRSNWKLKHY